MKLFGSISELIDLIFRIPGGKQVRINAASQTTSGSTIQVTVPDVAATGDNQNMVLTAATQTLTNKSLTLPRIASVLTNNGISTVTLPTSTTTLVGRDTTDTLTNKTITGATISSSTISLASADLVDVLTPAYKTKLKSNSSPALSADRDLTFDLNNADRIIDVGGNLTFGGNFTTSGPFTKSGSHSTELITTASTSVTLPTSGTLSTLAGSETLQNKVIDSTNTFNGIKLSAFASTTSAELAGVISNETGSGSLVFANDATMQNPTFNGHYLGSTTGSIATGTLTAASAGSLLRITSAANFSMIANPTAGRQYVIVNETATDITVANDSGATAANRIYTGTGADFTFKANSAVSVIYDNSISRWVLTGGGGAGGLATTYVTAGGITAVASTHYLTNLSAAGQTITLPAGVNGSVIRFSDAGEKWDVYPLTIAPATGEKIDALATNETLVCDVKRGWVELSYNSTFGGWALMSLASTSGSAAGSGEVNAILNPTAASGTTGWTGVTQVSSGSPLDPIVTSAFSISNAAAAESSTSGGYYSISSLAPSLKSRKLKVSFYFSTPATDVYRVSVYAGSTRLSLSSDSSGATTLPANVTGGYFEAYFDSSSASAYSLNITRTSGSTGACVITQVVVGPGSNAQGAAISEWQSYTDAVTNGGTATFSYAARRYRRVGSSAEIIYQFSATANGSGAGFVTVPLPAGLTIDQSVVPNDNILGVFWRYVSGSSTGAMFYPRTFFPSLTNGIILGNSAGGAFTGANVANGDTYYLRVVVPIAEWAGNGTVNLGAGAQIEYVSHNGTATVYGPQGSAMPVTTTAVARTVTFQYPIQNDDVITLEWSNSQSGPWISSDLTTEHVTPVQWATYNTTTDVGWGEIRPVSSTQISVVFRWYRLGTTPWNGSADGYWRVRKSKASAPVGFGLAGTDGSSGLYKAGQAPGYTGAGAIAAGYIGEVKSVIQSSASATTSSTGYTNVGSVTLTPGVWSVDMAGLFLSTGTSVITEGLSLGFSTDSSTGFSDRDDTPARSNQIYFSGGTGNFTAPGQSMTNYRIGGSGSCAPITVTSNTTYYLKYGNRCASGSAIEAIGLRLIFTRRA